MLFINQEEALKFLRELGKLIIPTQFTYFNHCACYQFPQIQSTQHIKKAWTELPIKSFEIRREMSFVERNQRILSALGYGSVERAAVTYALAKFSKPFMIRVLIPKNNLTEQDRIDMNIDYEYQQHKKKAYMGLGDGRHPKLPNGEKVHIFACATKDEVSGQKIDIFYGLREQDILIYANVVSKELSKNQKIREGILPVATLVAGQTYYTWDRNLYIDENVYSISISKNFNRYYRKSIVDSKGKIQLIQFSEFEQEYLQEFKEEFVSLFENQGESDIINEKNKLK